VASESLTSRGGGGGTLAAVGEDPEEMSARERETGCSSKILDVYLEQRYGDAVSSLEKNAQQLGLVIPLIGGDRGAADPAFRSRRVSSTSA